MSYYKGISEAAQLVHYRTWSIFLDKVVPSVLSSLKHNVHTYYAACPQRNMLRWSPKEIPLAQKKIYFCSFQLVLPAAVEKKEEISNILTQRTSCSPSSFWPFLISFFRSQRSSGLNISFYRVLLWFCSLLHSMKVFQVIMQQLGFAEGFWTVQELASKLVILINSCSFFWCKKICSPTRFCYCKNKTDKFPHAFAIFIKWFPKLKTTKKDKKWACIQSC